MPKRRVVLIPIIATERHCNNDCHAMSHDARHCNYLNIDLTWDPRKAYNGNFRPTACTTAEAKAQVINLKAKGYDKMAAAAEDLGGEEVT